MYIDELQLYLCTRLALNNITHLTITPNELYQFILGTNGCGKSSVMKELSPLPGDPDGFNLNGFKLIKISANNKKYILKNTYTKKPHHSFICIVGGVENEMNPGGTITVQKELVKQEFKLDNELHGLIIGEEKFHEMSPSRRREWFTRLSPVDYGYAFGLYDHFRVTTRDTVGALKNAKRQLVDAAAKVLSDEAVNTLQKEVSVTVKELNILLRETNSNVKPYDVLKSEQKNKLDTLNSLATQLSRLRLLAPYGTTVYGLGFDTKAVRDDSGELLVPAITSLEQIDLILNKLTTKDVELTALIELRYADLSREDARYKTATLAGDAGVDEIKQRIISLHQQSKDIIGRQKLGLKYIDNKSALSSLIDLEPYLSQLFINMKNNSDGKYSSVKLQQQEVVVSELQNKIHTMSNYISALNANLSNAKMLLARNAVNCPNCKHSWHLDNIQERIDNTNKDIDKQVGLFDESKALLVKAEAELLDLRDYANVFVDYIKTTRTANSLVPLWTHISDNSYVKDSPSIIPNVINKAIAELEDLILNDKLTAEIKQNSELLIAITSLGDEKILDIKEKVDNIRNEIDSLTHQKHSINKQLSSYQTYRKQLNEAFSLQDSIRKGMSEVDSITTNMVEAYRQKTIEHCLSQLQTSLAGKQSMLDEAIILKNNVSRLEETIMTLTKEEEYGKIILKEMSPTDGLIAKGLLGFVKSFTKRMNSLLRKVWTYPLIINDCSTVNGNSIELDYYFPLTVQDASNRVSDVKLGSTAMRQIVDLAFVIETMKASGIANFPLYLDEFGSGFDEKHRSGAADTIKSIMDTQSHSQLFMISHYSTVYGAFTNAEFCVLDTRNIVAPSINNKHVTIIQS